MTSAYAARCNTSGVDNRIPVVVVPHCKPQLASHPAFGASLEYLIATTVAVAVASVFLPGRPKPAPAEAQSVNVASSSSAAA